MAFDLVHYFAEQTAIQKPQLFSSHPREKRNHYIFELNVLALGKIIQLWREDESKLYQEIHKIDPLYLQGIARHLVTSSNNQSELPAKELETALMEILALQFTEIKQLDDTGNFGQNGLRELLTGQVEHLSGQADDWVWSTNQLTELVGSKPQRTEEISLDETMKEFNLMVNTAHPHIDTDHHSSIEVPEPHIPGWSKIIAPVIAFVILIFLYCQYTGLTH
ncbi:hypothetical protein IAE19_12995 [Acinetobacter sp. S40]|uniref:hypothetical protein n=1 Tax=unclassified Acinetobacter TaxID=196816 RepID=UPI001909156A|nr:MULTISPECIES: hypothetical protein [unclassified Acinetobacter]MBJ9986350.1 hypothetical protein [Acinetobacter sp. S40]MBK0064415.1 hypothetical protein [Acinetobacter sp. S55]MBK0067780.1 hypothetical protein [Acinetobacter sp. S54]